MDRVDVEMVKGLPIAVPARSVADAGLNPALSDKLLRSAVDILRNRRLMGLDEAVRVWERMDDAGARRLLVMAGSGLFDQESEGERRAFREVFQAHPPIPDCQVNLLANLRVDFVFLSAALIIEYHGSTHDTTADHDATRTYALERLGYRILVVTKSMLREPARLAAHIHGIRQQREEQIRSGDLVRPALPVSQLSRTDLRTLVPLG